MFLYCLPNIISALQVTWFSVGSETNRGLGVGTQTEETLTRDKIKKKKKKKPLPTLQLLAP